MDAIFEELFLPKSGFGELPGATDLKTLASTSREMSWAVTNSFRYRGERKLGLCSGTFSVYFYTAEIGKGSCVIALARSLI